jgi:hypothetical protein
MKQRHIYQPRYVRAQFVWICLFLATLHPAHAQSPHQFQLRGVITDSDQDAIAGATVTLVSGGEYRSGLHETLDADRALVESQSGADGIYRVSFSTADKGFLRPGRLTLLIRAAGFQTSAMTLHPERLFVDVPLDVDLLRDEPARVTVVDSYGDPIAGAQLYPASIRGVQIAWAAAQRCPPAITADDGVATLPSCHWQTLDGLYVVDTTCGNQMLKVTVSQPGELTVQTIPTRPVVGNILQADSEQSVPGIESTRLLAITIPPDGSQGVLVPEVCSWALVPISATGDFHVPRIGCGNLYHALDHGDTFAYRMGDAPAQIVVEPSPSEFHWQLRYERADRFVITVLDAESGAPLPNVSISNVGDEAITGPDGKVAFYGRPRYFSFYPHHTWGDHFCDDAFYKDTQQVPVDGVVHVEPVTLIRNSSWRGKVVAADGKPVAGAKIDFSFSKERFNQNGVAFSDVNGEFQLRGVADKATVEISASLGSAMSDPVSLVIPADNAPPLVLTERPVAEPSGRIVDSDGVPVRHVGVKLQKAAIRIKETHHREKLDSVDLYETPVVAWTDESGVFLFPPTVELDAKIQVQLRSQQFFPFCSPYINAAQRPRSSDGKLDLGQFTVLRRPTSRPVTISVRNESAAPIAAAQVVIVGGRTTTATGVTDSQGSFHTDLAGGNSVVAVRDKQNRVSFATLAADVNEREVILSPAGTADDSSFTFDRAAFRAAAQTLFDQIETPDLKSTSHYRAELYGDALASMSPKDLMTFVDQHRRAFPSLGWIAMIVSEKAIQQQPELLSDVVQRVTMPAAVQFSLTLLAADACEDVAQQDEWLGEALVAARKCSRNQRRENLAELAKVLLSAGRTDLAKQLTAEAWAGDEGMQQLLEKNQRKQDIGLSRTIGTALAMLDLEKSQQLIALTAQPSEIDSLKSEALLIWGQANPDDFIARLEQDGVDRIDNIWRWLHGNTERRRLVRHGVPRPLAVSDRITDSLTRLSFLLHHARIASDSLSRRELLDRAADVIDQCAANSNSDHFLLHHSRPLLQTLRMMPDIDPGQRDDLLFQALWNSPSDFDTDRLQTVLGGTAQLLALHDPAVARTFLEPALQDRGWMFTLYFNGISNDECLLAPARIDPAWAVQIANEICEEDLADRPSDQLELRSGMITRLIDQANQ